MTEMELYRIINETHEKLDKLIEQQEVLIEKIESLNKILDENTKNKAPN